MNRFKGYKTVGFAVLFGLIHIAGLVGYADYTPSTDVAEIVGIITSIVVVALRYVTTTPLGKSE